MSFVIYACRIGGYFVVRVPKNISYKELQSKLIQKMTSAVIDSETPADLEVKLLLSELN